MLVRHEYTSRPHLESLLSHLQSIDPDTPIPLPVVTTSFPPVILDGHHRVAASRIFGLKKIPVWQVDESEEVQDWEHTFIRCYSRNDGARMSLKSIIDGARAGRIDWGIKGTRHVAVLELTEGVDGMPTTDTTLLELELDRITPTIKWKLWMDQSMENSDSDEFL